MVFFALIFNPVTFNNAMVSDLKYDHRFLLLKRSQFSLFPEVFLAKVHSVLL